MFGEINAVLSGAGFNNLERYVWLWRGNIINAVLFFSLFVIIWEVLKAVFSAGFRKPSFKRQIPVKKDYDLKEYYPIIAGALAGYSIMSQKPLLALLAAFYGALVGYVGKKFYGWFMNKLKEEKRIGEIILLYEIISVYAAAGYSLLEALNAATYFLNLTKDALQKCVNSWGQGPERALDKFGKELRSVEGEALARTLKRAVEVGPSKLADFLDHESKTIENIRQYKIEQGFGARTIVQTIYLVLPGLALVGVTLLPAGYHVSKMIMSLRSGF